MRNQLGLLMITLLVAAPVASATWYAKGTYEPDTTLDSASFMRTTADISATNANGDMVGKERLVYFNAFQGAYLGYVAGVPTQTSPNVAGGAAAPVRTSVHTYPTTFYAMLGAWKDCNADGYVGLGEQGAWEYRAELLTAFTTNICKPGSVPLQTSGASAGRPVKNTPFPHNDGTWIHEFIPVGWDQPPTGSNSNFDSNPVNINDSASRVWGDWNKPDAPPGGTCYVRPHPRGTFHTSGNLIDYADCFGSGRINQQGAALGATWTTIKSVKNPWGEESDAAIVSPWDCSQGTTKVEVTNGNTRIFVTNLSQPSTSPSPNSAGSVAGTMNATGAGTDQCNRSTLNDGYSHNGATLGTVPYGTEGDVINTPQARNQPDHMMYYSEGQRPAPTLGALPGHKYGDADPTATGATTFAPVVGYGVDGFWVGNAVTAASRNPFFTRDALGNFGAQPVTYTSFYASIGVAAKASYNLKMPSAAVGVYGSVACPTIGVGQGVGPTNWQCNPNNWWKDANGQDVNPKVAISGVPDITVGPVVGATYQLRDVDCYDYSAQPGRGNGVSYGTLTGTRCV